MSDEVTKPKRPRGRPKGSTKPDSKTKAQLGREYRQRNAIVGMTIPKHVRELLTRARLATGLSGADVLRQALQQYAA